MTDESMDFILAHNFNKDELSLIIQNDAAKFDEVLKIALTGNQPEAWRATWLLGSSMNFNDERIRKKIGAILKLTKNVKDGNQREWLKILNNLELNDDNEGILFNLCVNIWEEINKSPSVRIIAFKILIKIAGKYPELNREIESLTRDEYRKTLSPGIAHSFDRLRNNFSIN